MRCPTARSPSRAFQACGGEDLLKSAIDGLRNGPLFDRPYCPQLFPEFAIQLLSSEASTHQAWHEENGKPLYYNKIFGEGSGNRTRIFSLEESDKIDNTIGAKSRTWLASQPTKTQPTLAILESVKACFSVESDSLTARKLHARPHNPLN